MDKTAKTEFQRLFLVEGLPEPLAPASSHIQIFDNYIANTRIRLRSIRDPDTKTWTRILDQRFAPSLNSMTEWKSSAIYLNDNEYSVFARFEGREVRKNRYFHEFDGRSISFDVHLGKLWGLCTAKARFRSAEETEIFVVPPFAVFEITNQPFFFGVNIVEQTFEDVRAEILRAKMEPLKAVVPDE